MITKEELKEAVSESLLEALHVAEEKQRQDAEVIKKNSGIPWDTIYKISQIAVFPALAVIFYMLTQLGNLDRRVTITELVQATRPNFVELTSRIAVIEEKQRVEEAKHILLEKEFSEHRFKSTYDKGR